MNIVVIAMLCQHPVACEGNDDPLLVKAVRLRARANRCTSERAERVAQKLARRHRCYALVWDIA